MPQAVGSLETRGFPPVLAAADAMVKAGRVTLIGYIRAGSARFAINIRGDGGWGRSRRKYSWWHS
jgi:microcompartment protein CcmL/EutN